MRKEDLIVQLVGTKLEDWSLRPFGNGEARFASHPLMPLRLFRSRAVSAANAILVLVGAAYLSMFYFVSLYLQNVLGFGPLKSGLVLVPHSLGIAVGARAAPRLVSRIGTRPTILVGTLVSAAGFLWQSRITDANTILSGVICPGVLIALSGGIVSAPLIATATSGVERSEAGIVSGIANTARMAGGSLGLAALAAVASGRTQALLVGRSHTTVQMGEALTAGYSLVFVVSTFLLLIAAGAAEALPEGTDKSVETKEVSS
jgi:predicted MFS family arabinose efflux permease